MNRWWVLKDRLRHGPFTLEEISRHCREGRFHYDDFLIAEEKENKGSGAHHTIREIMGIALSPRPSKTHSEHNVVFVDRRDHSTRPDDIDALPSIKNLIAKIEAVELIDVKSQDSGEMIQVKAEQHDASPQSFSDLGNVIKKFAPGLMVLGVVAAGVLFVSENFQSTFDVASSNKETTPRAPAQIPSTLKPAIKSDVSPVIVSVPEKSERSERGFESRPERKRPIAEESEAPLSDAREDFDELEDEQSRTKSYQTKKAKIKKLRDAVAPKSTDSRGFDEEIPGVEEEENDIQQDYDLERGIAGEDGEAESGRPPKVDTTDELEKEEVVDEAEELGYQE